MKRYIGKGRALEGLMKIKLMNDQRQTLEQRIRGTKGLMKIKLMNDQRQTLEQRIRGTSGYRKGDSGVIRFPYGRRISGRITFPPRSFIRMFDGGYLALGPDVRFYLV
jgi:hypothetical protein